MNASGKTASVAVKATAPFALLTKVKDIQAESTRLKGVGNSYQHDLHVLACSVLQHVHKNGQINVLVHFLADIPDSVRVNSLQTWFETFGIVSYKAAMPGDKAAWRIDRTKTTKLGDAMVKPFWKFKALEGAPYQPLDMNKFIESTIKTLTKDKEALVKANPNADVSKQNALIMALKTHGATPAN